MSDRMNNITLTETADKLRKSEDIILISHTSPDGDTVGAVTALAVGLKNAGKKVTALCDSDIPDYLQFICEGLYRKDSDEDGLIVSVDVASSQMLGKLEEKFGNRVDIRIDHHASGTDFAEYNYCVPDAAACCEIIYELLTEMNLMNSVSAGALYLGLSTDSGSFRYSCTTPKTLRIAADLIEAGADSEDINERLYENLTVDSLRADCFFLDKMERYMDGSVLVVPVSIADRTAAGLTDEQLEGFSTLARKISGVQLGISLREKEPGVYKVSMRSRKSVDCAAICAVLGGGGHIRAAGATIKASCIEEAKKLLITAVTEQIGEQE